MIVFQDWDENSCASPPTIKSKFVRILLKQVIVTLYRIENLESGMDFLFAEMAGKKGGEEAWLLS